MPGGAPTAAPPTVALDGFGAERGFDVLAAGARIAAADGIRVRIFGPGDGLGLDGAEGIEIVPTAEWIGNEDEPVAAVRSRPTASIVRAATDVSDGNADAMASVGSTGATMAAATFGLRRLQGVQRPALAAVLPLPAKQVLFLDVGANVEARAQHLIQFAFLGAAFSSAVLGVADPTVGLLSVGEESSKGSAAVIEAHRVLSAAQEIEFAGNFEGTDLADPVDVIVTDGFTGNVALKFMEGTSKLIGAAIRDAARSNPLAAAGGLLMRPALGGLRTKFDPETTGGAVLLGLRRPAVVGHGASGAEGVANAVRLAARCVEQGAVERTEQLLRAGHATRGGLAESSHAASAEA